MKRFRVSVETTREQFRSIIKDKEEAYSEFAVKLTSLASTWLQDETTGRLHDSKKMLDMILLEQFLSNMPSDIRTWLLDKGVNTITEAADYADSYVQVRRSVNNCMVAQRVHDPSLLSNHDWVQGGKKHIASVVNVHSSACNAPSNTPVVSAISVNMPVNNELRQVPQGVQNVSDTFLPNSSTCVPSLNTFVPSTKIFEPEDGIKRPFNK